MARVDVYINDVLQPDCLQARTWAISLTANRRSTARGSLFSGVDEENLLRVNDGDKIRIDIDEVPMFGGEIEKPTERSAGGVLGVPFYTDFVARDFYGRVTRRLVNETIPAGTLKAALLVLVEYLPGVTLDPDQVVGPMLPELPLSDVPTSEAIKLILDCVPGWIAEIDELEVFRVFEPGTVAAPFNIGTGGVMPIGDIPVERPREGYANRAIVRNASHRVVVQDDDAIDDEGEWDMRVDADDAFDAATLEIVGETALAAALAQPRIIRFPVDVAGLKPGQATVVTYAPRQLNATFLCTDVDVQEMGGGEIVYSARAIEGLVFKEGYRAMYDRWSGGANVVTATAGASVTRAKRAYLLSTGIDAVVTGPVGTGVPAAGGGAPGQAAIQVQFDTALRGTNKATITGRLRVFDAGVEATARLYDASIGEYVPGESATVGTTTWSSVTFGVTCTDGNNFYEIHVFSNVEGALVSLSSYGE